MMTCITIIPLARNETEHGKKKNAFECFGQTRGHHATKIFRYLTPKNSDAMRFDTLEKICEVFACQAGDILAFTKD